MPVFEIRHLLTVIVGRNTVSMWFSQGDTASVSEPCKLIFVFRTDTFYPYPVLRGLGGSRMTKVHLLGGNSSRYNSWGCIMLTNIRYNPWALIFLPFVVPLILHGCTTPPRLAAVPVELQDEARIPGIDNIRYRVGKGEDSLAREGMESVRREQAYLASIGQKGPLPPAIFLAISGGGDNGAFGAGLLNGWSAAGDRPQFKLVTGVSTGALTAPFAFLGSEYDVMLEEFYTTTSTIDIMEARGLLSVVTSDALNDNRPLWNQLEKHVTRDLLNAIAAEYEKGRLLLVATVDFDARHPIIWNLTKIAASSDPKALELFRAVMIASAAIPVAFPPVMIDVEAGGQQFQEMHVDGGTMGQVFIYPPSLNLKSTARQMGIERERKLYIIRNSRLDPDWVSVERKTLTIIERAINSLVQSQGIGDLYRIFAITQRDEVDYNLAYIPATFNASRDELFDPVYMGQLFKVGYELAAKGYRWQKIPPGGYSLSDD
jgi:Patatin-like phospholipase